MQISTIYNRYTTINKKKKRQLMKRAFFEKWAWGVETLDPTFYVK